MVTFCETRVVHCDSMERRESIPEGEIADEIYEYKNLCVLKAILLPSLPSLTTTLTEKDS